ncbi:hypothetical protein L228DRAFT_58943 [Xylona heveae TC161]|uniref:Velvet domain-containing protein n=1 Tax=Xylona heveae (strain CBS 132557 / TC161) TaxID=1328760 RepID=A0A165IIS8_XYLHT|nr:hypothetical protein L228DRAFT_58943 [Xylona heveae TC161]KZF24951.1 hypothetical protein L228DRAFT_58943 [Xylona heveae TC161]
MRICSDDYDLRIRQQPERARVAGPKEKDRKPVDPPPIIQLRIRDESDPAQNYLQSPYYFMCCNLFDASEDRPAESPQNALAGTLVSSLHRLKDIDNSDGGFFVFGDLSVKMEGEYRLRFSLFEMLKTEVVHIKSIVSETFTVYSAKSFPGMSESTFLSRSFGDQGVRLRIRKEPRTLLRKRPPTAGMRPEEFPRAYPLQGPFDAAAQFSPFPGTAMGAYVPTGMRDYPTTFAEPSTKRQRTSADVSTQDIYARDPRYGQRVYQDPQNPYAAYAQPGATQGGYGYAPAPYAAPTGMPEHSYRYPPPVSSSVSSPYGSPRTQSTVRSPSGMAPTYQPSRLSSQSYAGGAQYPLQVPQLADPSSRQPSQAYDPSYLSGRSLQSTSNAPTPSGGVTRIMTPQNSYAAAGAQGMAPAMAPPATQQRQSTTQQQPPFTTVLPPLQSSGASISPGPSASRSMAGSMTLPQASNVAGLPGAAISGTLPSTGTGRERYASGAGAGTAQGFDPASSSTNPPGPFS